MTSLFIFRRDLRLIDNLGLKKALAESRQVIPCFILDPRQLQQPYRSDFAVSFMIDSLISLDKALKEQGSKLALFYGKAHEVVDRLVRDHKIEGVYLNKDYTPFSLERDQAIEQVCKASSVRFTSCSDLLLVEPGTLKTLKNTPYTIFTPFFRTAQKINVPPPATGVPKGTLYSKKIKDSHEVEELKSLCKLSSISATYHGGREKALEILDKIARFENYAEARNSPALDQTTHLSPHHKFGTVSIRESYWKIHSTFGPTHPLISELYWRDFFTQILFEFPKALNHPFQEKYAKLKWSENKDLFNAWCTGHTGFPIVDAAMRELNETGFMHNRCRMITASFLVKDLHINWKWGERYFAQKLVDYDPAVNNGNWQWAASTGCDAQPYFRIFNPWSQQKKFDPDAKYIKRWVLKLRPYSPKEIHEFSGSLDYPAPIIDHAVESAKTKSAYSKC